MQIYTVQKFGPVWFVFEGSHQSWLRRFLQNNDYFPPSQIDHTASEGIQWTSHMESFLQYFYSVFYATCEPLVTVHLDCIEKSSVNKTKRLFLWEKIIIIQVWNMTE